MVPKLVREKDGRARRVVGTKKRVRRPLCSRGRSSSPRDRLLSRKGRGAWSKIGKKKEEADDGQSRTTGRVEYEHSRAQEVGERTGLDHEGIGKKDKRGNSNGGRVSTRATTSDQKEMFLRLGEGLQETKEKEGACQKELMIKERIGNSL